MQNKYTFRLALNTSLIVINSRSELLDAAAQRALWGNLLGTGQQRISTGEVELQFGAETTWTRDRLWYILLKCWAALKGSERTGSDCTRWEIRQQRDSGRSTVWATALTGGREGGKQSQVAIVAKLYFLLTCLISSTGRRSLFDAKFFFLPKFSWIQQTFWSIIQAANNLVTIAETKICGVHQSSVWNFWQSHNNMSIVEAQQFVSTHIAPYIFIRHRHCVCSLQLASHHLCFLVALPSFGTYYSTKIPPPLRVALIFLQNGMHFIS